MNVSPVAASARRGRSWFYSVMSGVVLLAVGVGFGRTYALPMAQGTFRAPAVVHVHGIFAAAWVLLFALQPLLLRFKRLAWHRNAGRLGVPLALGMLVTMLPAGMVQTRRDAETMGAAGISGLLGVATSGIIFVMLVIAGIRARRDREAHARWLLLATLLVAWPAWFRFRHYFPDVQRPDIWFALVLADVWIVVAMLRDRLSRGTVHPVLAWAGTGVLLEQTLEAIAFDSGPWRAAAQALFDGLRGVGL